MGRQLLGLLVLDLEKRQVFWAGFTEECNWTLSLNMREFIILIYSVIKWYGQVGMINALQPIASIHC